SSLVRILGFETLQNEPAKIIDVEEITNLSAQTVEARVLQWLSEIVVCDPQRKHTLIHFARLPGTGDNTAAEDERFYIVVDGKFLHEILCAQFARSIEGSGLRGWEILRYSFTGNAWNRLNILD